MDLVEELPDDYKPTDEVIKILQEKGYEVLDQFYESYKKNI